MPEYKQLDRVELARRENQELIKLQGRQILRRVLNEALVEMEYEFQAALNQGQILELDADKDDLRQLLATVSQKVLGQ